MSPLVPLLSLAALADPVPLDQLLNGGPIPEAPAPIEAPAEAPAGAPAAEQPADAESLARAVFEAEEMLVIGDRVERARRELESALRGMGYEPTRRRGGRTYWRARGDDGWKPRIWLYDDGWMRFKSPQVVAQTPRLVFGDLTHPRELEIALDPQRTTALVVEFNFWMTSKRKLARQEEILVDATRAQVAALADALALESMAATVEALPATLDRIWLDGVGPDGADLAGPEARREAVLQLWIQRADNAWGDAIRAVIEDYMRYEIQASPHPFTEAEIEGAWQRCHCSRRLELGG